MDKDKRMETTVDFYADSKKAKQAAASEGAKHDADSKEKHEGHEGLWAGGEEPVEDTKAEEAVEDAEVDYTVEALRVVFLHPDYRHCYKMHVAGHGCVWSTLRRQIRVLKLLWLCFALHTKTSLKQPFQPVAGHPILQE